jgi:hypothetical protein
MYRVNDSIPLLPRVGGVFAKERKIGPKCIGIKENCELDQESSLVAYLSGPDPQIG